MITSTASVESDGTMNKYLATGLGAVAGAALSITLTQVSDTVHNDCWSLKYGADPPCIAKKACTAADLAKSKVKSDVATSSCYAQHPILSWFTGYRGLSNYTHLAALTLLGGVAAWRLARKG